MKLLTTGMGEALSDFMGQTSIPLAALVGVGGFVVALRLQLRAREYRAPVYWFAVMMVAVFGTMVADGIKDGAGLSYAVTTPFFALCVAAVFWVWHRSEGTLSIHSITTRRREAFYWSAVLATFALGTAAGDLTAMTLHLGYFGSAMLFAALMAVPALLWWRGVLNPIAAFWIAYVITRPLGASFADGFASRAQAWASATGRSAPAARLRRARRLRRDADRHPGARRRRRSALAEPAQSCGAPPRARAPAGARRRGLRGRTGMQAFTTDHRGPPAHVASTPSSRAEVP